MQLNVMMFSVLRIYSYFFKFQYNVEVLRNKRSLVFVVRVDTDKKSKRLKTNIWDQYSFVVKMKLCQKLNGNLMEKPTENLTLQIIMKKLNINQVMGQG